MAKDQMAMKHEIQSADSVAKPGICKVTPVMQTIAAQDKSPAHLPIVILELLAWKQKIDPQEVKRKTHLNT